MISEKQHIANILNSPKSTGPTTEAGKKRSSLNATRHGLTGQVVVLPEEDLVAFTKFATGIVESFHPADDNEHQLAQSYADFQWRINRAAAVENNLFTLGFIEEVAENLNIEHPEIHNAASNAKTFRQQSIVFNRISLYSQRLVRNAAVILKQLQDTQAERRHREEAQLHEAAQLLKLHQMLEKAFDPQANGFVFSLDQVTAQVTREHLAAQCQIAQNASWDRPGFLKAGGQAAA